MSIAQLCPDDLLLAARHGALSAPDEARLSHHLSRCERCRAALDVGRAFDGTLGARIGDDAIASRIAAEVTQRPSRRWLGYAMGAGLLLFGSVAVAAVGSRVWQRLFVGQQVQRTVTDVASNVGGAEQAPGALPRPRRVDVQLPPPPSAAPSASEPEVASAARSPVASSPVTGARAPAPEADTAKVLFARANALRSEGDTRGARSAYLELQSRFAGSAEAKVSLVSLGRIELGSEPARALGHFDAYLAQSQHTTLVEEALFGRASALGRLGRAEQERSTWQKLIERFPTSVYAERAKARLAPSGTHAVQSQSGTAVPSTAVPSTAVPSTAVPRTRRQ